MRTGDGWILVLVLALGALGDVLLETAGMTIGAVSFLMGHIVAIEDGRLKGRIYNADKIRRESEQIVTDPAEAEGATEWDLSGNSLGVSTQDLMEVLR